MPRSPSVPLADGEGCPDCQEREERDDAGREALRESHARLIDRRMPSPILSLLLAVAAASAFQCASTPDAERAADAAQGVTDTTVTAEHVVDSALVVVRRHALWRDTVTWSVVEPEVRALVDGATSPGDADRAVRHLLVRLGDAHSVLMDAAEAERWRTPGGIERRTSEIRVIDRVGYVMVPGYTGGDVAAARIYARTVHAALDSARHAAPCGWIVDLRQNDGGNMYPMLAALKPLLGDGVVGAFERPAGSPPDSMGAWVPGQWVGLEPPPPPLMTLADVPVAVITGPGTASSGEAVTVAFRGRPRTRSFGQPTAGYSTGNDLYALPGGAVMALTTNVFADRTGRRYGGAVDPDQRIDVEGLDGPSLDGNPAITAAITWLRRESACSGSGSQRGAAASQTSASGRPPTCHPACADP